MTRQNSHKSSQLMLLLSTLLLCFATTVIAAPVSIFLKETAEIASDLEHENEILSEQSAFELRDQHFDLSTLNPDQNTDYWKLGSFKAESNSEELIDTIHTPVMKYLNTVNSEVGTVRLNVSVDGKTFLLQLSRANHKMLMRKTLLEKLGYTVAPMQWLPSIKLKIDPILLQEIKKNLAIWVGEPKSWIVNESKDELVLQDVVLFESSLSLYHLATGYIPRSTKKTRLFNSLPLAYSLLEYPDTGLDQLSWSYGTLAQERLNLDFNQNISNFNPTYDDARWIARFISKLSRKDFKEIIASSRLPAEVQQYLLEKIISRRNSMLERLNLESDILFYDENIEIKSKKFKGYADTFKSTQAPAPLGRKNLVYYGEALLQSGVLTVAIDEYNKSFMPQTNIGAKVQEQEYKAFMKKINSYIDTGVDKDIPLGVYAFPFGGARLILSRDVITGSYMGSKNLVQKADSFGFSVNAGTFVGFNGLPANVMANISGEVYFNRIYTHIRPLREIKAVFKEPFHNIFVETKRKEIVQQFDKVIKAAQSGKATTKEDLISLKSALDRIFPVGDSLVMTDSLGSSLGGQLGYGFHKDLRLFVGANVSGRLIRRVNIFRATEKTLQIYVDNGRIGDVTISVNLDSVVPVMSWQQKVQKAQMDVKLYGLSLDVEQDTSLALKDFATLNNILKHVDVPAGSTPLIQSVSGIKNNEKTFRLLGFSLGSQSSRFDLKVSAPNVPPRTLLRLKKSSYEDWDVLSMGKDTTNAAIDKFLDSSFELNIKGSAVAGENLLGKSKIFDASLDAVVGEGKELSQVYYSSKRINKKWKVSSQLLKKQINSSNALAGSVVFDPKLASSVNSIQFYTMLYQTIVYPKGIEKLTGLTKDDFLRVMTNRSSLSPKLKQIDGEKLGRIIRHLLISLKKFHKLKAKKSPHAAKYLLAILMKLDKSMTFTGLQLLLGHTNLALLPSIHGYKTGGMTGFDIMKGNVLGRISAEAPYGPIMNIVLNTSFLESELLSTWLVKGVQ